MFAGRAGDARGLEKVLAEAVEAVKRGRGAVVEAVLAHDDLENGKGVVREVALREMDAEGD